MDHIPKLFLKNLMDWDGINGNTAKNGILS